LSIAADAGAGLTVAAVASATAGIQGPPWPSFFILGGSTLAQPSLSFAVFCCREVKSVSLAARASSFLLLAQKKRTKEKGLPRSERV
jgi:hypothetical protein